MSFMTNVATMMLLSPYLLDNTALDLFVLDFFLNNSYFPIAFGVFVDNWAQFHQRFMYNFYARRSQKRKKIQLSHKYLFTLLGSTGAKAACRTLMKLTPG